MAEDGFIVTHIIPTRKYKLKYKMLEKKATLCGFIAQNEVVCNNRTAHQILFL